jgi:hypothetical protein
MPFGLCNVFVTFLKMITKTFKYLDQFMEVFLDDLIFYNNKEDPQSIAKMSRKMLCELHINFNLEKCAFCVNLGVLLGHIIV